MYVRQPGEKEYVFKTMNKIWIANFAGYVVYVIIM